MASRLKPILWESFKWIVVPSGLALLGFYVIGANLGSPATAKNSNKASAELASEGPSGKKFAEPEVEVSVRRGAQVNSSEDRKGERPRRRRTRRTTTTTTNNESAPAPAVQSAPADPPWPGVGDGGGE